MIFFKVRFNFKTENNKHKTLGLIRFVILEYIINSKISITTKKTEAFHFWDLFFGAQSSAFIKRRCVGEAWLSNRTKPFNQID
jgi:hypothetical protein